MERELLDAYDLGRLADVLPRFEQRAVAFSLSRPSRQVTTRSRLGGRPLLPPSFAWPRSTERALDFLLQIDLAEVAPLDPAMALPPSGLLTFFYDLVNQPWGFDPNQLDGFRVVLISDQPVVTADVPDSEVAVPEQALTFSAAVTLPHFGSRAYDRLEQACRLSQDEGDRYADFVDAYEAQYSPEGSGAHRLLGHSANVQGDMQLEAQLVSNGLYCGDPSGYEDPRARALEAGADDWTLLLQLDSDDGAEVMWGDGGKLYYWIRREDLSVRRFERAWMALQCF